MKLRNVRARQWRALERRHDRHPSWAIPPGAPSERAAREIFTMTVYGPDGEVMRFPFGDPVHPADAARLLMPERVDTPEGPITIRITVDGGWTTITATMPDGTTRTTSTYSALFGPT